MPLTIESIAGILPRGGTILGTTNRGNPFRYVLEENGKKITHDYTPRGVARTSGSWA